MSDSIPIIQHLTDDPKTNINLIKFLSEQIYPDEHILANLMAAQAILESDLTHKPSSLANKYNNLFGIKGKGTHKPEPYIELMTHEYNHKTKHWMIVREKFAWNATLEDSLQQHKNLLSITRYKPVHNCKTFEEAAEAIREAGYATDPLYSKQLIEIYKQYLK